MLKPKTVKIPRHIKRLILADPRNLNMHALLENRIEVDDSVYTAGCIAGWASIFAELDKRGLKIAALNELSDGVFVGIPEGQAVLGITDLQAHRLFYTAFWPVKYSKNFMASSKQEQAKKTAQRIEYFIRTNGYDRFKDQKDPKNLKFLI